MEDKEIREAHVILAMKQQGDKLIFKVLKNRNGACGSFVVDPDIFFTQEAIDQLTVLELIEPATKEE